jgi:hypothetical protein
VTRVTREESVLFVAVIADFDVHESSICYEKTVLCNILEKTLVFYKKIVK